MCLLRVLNAHAYERTKTLRSNRVSFILFAECCTTHTIFFFFLIRFHCVLLYYTLLSLTLRHVPTSDRRGTISRQKIVNPTHAVHLCNTFNNSYRPDRARKRRPKCFWGQFLLNRFWSIFWTSFLEAPFGSRLRHEDDVLHDRQRASKNYSSLSRYLNQLWYLLFFFLFLTKKKKSN